VKVALQTWTVREGLSQDVPSTLSRLAAFGVQHLEVSSTGRVAPTAFAEEARKHRMKIIGTHEQPFYAAPAKLDKIKARARTYGAPMVTAVLCDWTDRSTQFYLRLAAQCRDVASEFAKEGLTLCFHPFTPDLEPIDHQSGVDILLKATQPTELMLQLDTIFVHKAGLSLESTLRSYEDRTVALHLNDCHANGSHCAVGKGILEFHSFVKHLRAFPKLQWLILEHDVRNPWVTLEHSVRFCQEQGLLNGQ
jgi:sugar phosphate isomerase/epimerase